MRVEVRNVGDIVTMLLEPERRRKFPEQKLARARGERRVQNLAVLPVRAIEPDFHITAPIPLLYAIIVEGKLRRPAVVSLPSVVTALENKVGLAVIADNKDDVALNPLA